MYMRSSGVQLPAVIVSYPTTAPKLSLWNPAIAKSPHINSNAAGVMNQTIMNETRKLVLAHGYHQNPEMEVSGYYELKTNERGVLSLSLFTFGYAAGAAHGLTLQQSLTFETASGRLYTLADLFRPGTDYIGRLQSIVNAQVQSRDIPVFSRPVPVKPAQKFYIADKTLVLYYDIYEITPYVYQFPYFPISVYELGDIVDESGPLGRMIY